MWDEVVEQERGEHLTRVRVHMQSCLAELHEMVKARSDRLAADERRDMVDEAAAANEEGTQLVLNVNLEQDHEVVDWPAGPQRPAMQALEWLPPASAAVPANALPLEALELPPASAVVPANALPLEAGEWLPPASAAVPALPLASAVVPAIALPLASAVVPEIALPLASPVVPAPPWLCTGIQYFADAAQAKLQEAQSKAREAAAKDECAQARLQEAESKAREAATKEDDAQAKLQEAESKAHDAASKEQNARAKLQEAESKAHDAAAKEEEAQSKAQDAAAQIQQATNLMRELRRERVKLQEDFAAQQQQFGLEKDTFLKELAAQQDSLGREKGKLQMEDIRKQKQQHFLESQRRASADGQGKEAGRIRVRALVRGG